jgi:hypothetical protein
MALVVVVALAFGTAIYLGVRNPYQPLVAPTAVQLRTTVLPLAPQGRVPGGTPDSLISRSPAAHYPTGAAGITLPTARQTRNFSQSQVEAALSVAKDYLVASSLNPEVLASRSVAPVRALLDARQLTQFDHSVNSTVDTGVNVAIGWLVRFDPTKVALAGPGVRVQGALHYMETGPDALVVTSDHTFVYTVRPAGSTSAPVKDASLFTVRRQLQFRFDRTDLQQGRTELLVSDVQAGPQECSRQIPVTLLPLLAGQQAAANGPGYTNPFSRGPVMPAQCGVLAPAALP